MKFIDLVQGSSDWLQYRRTHIGASDCACVLGEGNRTPLQLFEDKMLGTKQKVTSAMAQGSAREDEARQLYNQKGIRFEPAVIESTMEPHMSASLDGINDNLSIILEIKVVGKKTWEEIVSGKIPRYIEWQLQHQLFCVTSAKYAILWVCTPIGDELIGLEIKVERNSEMIERLVEAERLFYHNNMMQFIPPDPVDADYEDRTDADFMFLALERQKIDSELKKLEYLDKINREKMIALANGRSCKGYGVTLTHSFRKGNVNYKSIPEIQEIDLEQYRAKPIEVWTLRV